MKGKIGIMKSLFYKKELHGQWDEKLEKHRPQFEQYASQIADEGRFPYENLQLLREIGYTKLTLPNRLGGGGYRVYDALLAHEKLGSLDGSTALIVAWTLMTVGELYEHRYWSEEQLAAFAKEVNNGAIINRAVSEFAMGSPARGGRPASEALYDGKDWIVNGRKNYTTGSYGLDYFLTAVWVEEHQQMGYFLIHKDTPGVSIEENWDVLSMRGTGSHDLVLKNVRLPKEALVELASDRAQLVNNGWLLLIPATYLGIAQAARDYAVQFAKTHSPNSIKGTIAELPNVQTLIGEMDLELTKARFALYGAAEAYDDKTRRSQLTNELSAAKSIVTNAALIIVDKAMRLAGAKSLQQSCPLQRYYRDVRAGLHNPPMDEITIQKLAGSALK
jgi:alkylation response protein AidB-like acyl-CoA dehydrogenase